jgi:methyltransferase (TIGR00027 family)
MAEEPLVRNVSDTALWVAVYRARETERPDALFRDPFAKRLAGERGQLIAKKVSKGQNMDWPMVTRTWLGDRILSERVAAGADVVVNLAAGLDARPYRMKLPPELRWVEVDLPGILAYKQDILKGEKPVCRLEQIACDLSDVPARRALFAKLGSLGKDIVVNSEGLLTYMEADAVAALADDLAAVPAFKFWLLDMLSPGLLKMLKKSFGEELAQAPFKFGPPEGPLFFEPHGWKAVEVHSNFKTAGKLGRLPFFMRLFSYLPESNGRQGKRPWGGICLFERK